MAETLMDAVPVGLFAIQGDALLALNRHMLELTGFSGSAIPVERFWHLIPEASEVREQLLQGMPVRFKIMTDQEERWVEFRGDTVRLQEQDVLCGCLVEVTSHIRFEQKMRSVEIASREMKVAPDKETVYSLVMDFAQDLLGYRTCAVLERDGDVLRIAKERGYTAAGKELRLPLNGDGITVAACTTNEAQYVPDVREDDRYIEGVPGACCEYAIPVTFKNQKFGVFDVQNDAVDSITPQDRTLLSTLASEMATVLRGLQTIEELRESENRYRILVETAKEGIIKLDPDETILFVNQSMSDLIGYAVEDLVGKNLRDITTEEQYAVFQEKTEQRRDGLRDAYEAVLRHKNGQLLNIIVSAAPYHDPDGSFAGTFAIMTDITRRKEVEKQAAFYHSLLRHDIRNKNQVILGYLELLMEMDLTDEQLELAELAFKSLESSNRLIQKVREIQRATEEQELQPVALDPLITDVLQEFASQFARQDVEVQYEPIDVRVEGNELIREIFVNIIGNAVAHAGANTITIASQAADKQVTISMADDGRGIPEAIKKDIFAKKVRGTDSSGSGLGLHVVKVIVDSCGGSIEVDSQPGQGTTFIIHLRKWQD